MKAVRFHEYGGIDVLRVEEVARPVPGPAQALVEVRATGIQPGEVHIRTGELHDRWPAMFPSGRAAIWPASWRRSARTSAASRWAMRSWASLITGHAEFVVVDDVALTSRPVGLPWDVAGSLYVADTVVISGTTGGVGSLAVQLARRRAATVIGLASEPNHAWLTAHGVVPVEYGHGVAERIRQASGGSVDAFIDTFGDG